MIESVGLDHVGLNVPDLDAAAEWYRETLGLKHDFAFAFPGVDFSGVVLRHPAGWRLELLTRDHMVRGTEVGHPMEAARHAGYSHFALQVDDLTSAYEGLLSSGATSKMAPQAAPEPGVEVAFVTDPWGNLIEVIQRHS